MSPLACFVRGFFALTLAGFVAPLVEAADSVAPGGFLKEVTSDTTASGPRVIRRELTADELSASLDFVVNLRLRGKEELEASIRSHRIVSRQEMEDKHLPLAADYNRVASWLKTQGFTLTLKDESHTHLFVRGTVAQISRALAVTFARVSASDGEFISAIPAPGRAGLSLPSDFASIVLGIDGLQPHIRMQARQAEPTGPTAVGGHFTPADLAVAYDVPASLDGAGQTVAIIMSAAPLAGDLAAFRSACGIQGAPGSYTVVNVLGGPTSASQTGNVGEATLDTEWSTALAPAADLRLYAIPSLTSSNLIAACVQILNDGIAQVASYSASGAEDEYPAATLEADSEVFAQLAAAGITLFCSSGDGGSNPNPPSVGNGYNATTQLMVEYPASDTQVTAVGGTTITFDPNWNLVLEGAWTPGRSGSGGGVSAGFSRPSWQTGAGIPAGGQRCVPDVAAVSTAIAGTSANAGAVVIQNGQTLGRSGTSLSSPLWAGLATLINQARAQDGLPTLGLLGPWIYPLIGTPAFNDVTTGNNGAYSATVGYDLCTGIGSPHLAELIAEIDEEISSVAPPGGTVAAGTPIAMSATAQGAAKYQWQLNGVNIPGATQASYSLPAAGATDNGAYSVAIADASGSRTYSIGALTTVSDARLLNLSARADVSAGAGALTAGFGISGTGSKNMLIRGIGPALADYGVPDVLAAPLLTLLNSAGGTIATDTSWGGSVGLNEIMAGVGAFALPQYSPDAVLLESFPAGQYTARVSGLNNSIGVALAELYDADPSPTSRLVNLSAQADIQTGANTLTAGFIVVAGPSGAFETVLIRGIGPALGDLGVAGTLAQPILTVYDASGNTVATNTGWNSPPVAGASPIKAGIESATVAVMASAGAFSVAEGSADDAMVLILPPGAYTAQVSGVNSSSGVGLVEIYEIK